jgi:Phosphotransferase enzyme family
MEISMNHNFESMDEVKNLPLLARGGQAGIYDLGEGKVLRVPNRPEDFDRIRYEYRVYALLAETTAYTPAVYELLEIEGVPAIVMERLTGRTMMSSVKRRPWTAKEKAVDLAELHHNLLNVHTSAGLSRAHANARHCIHASKILSDGDKSGLDSILDGLPDGDALCHGDFHPGNIIRQGDRDYIIDWSGASAGDYHADVAHTYVLLKVVPRVPGLSPMIHFLQKGIGRAIAATYLTTMQQLRPIDHHELSQWILVKAGERTYYGLASEKDHLKDFVHESLALPNGSRRDALPYRFL